jgi:nitrogen fixation protein NifU and related proteins
MPNTNEAIWPTHSIKFLESAFRSDRLERRAHADGRGKKMSDCGDFIEFFLTIDGNRIASISYTHTGCFNTNACANAVIDLLDGKNLEDAWELNPEDVADYLESLPEEQFHCAELATGALYLALADVRDKQRSPWKKLYH